MNTNLYQSRNRDETKDAFQLHISRVIRLCQINSALKFVIFTNENERAREPVARCSSEKCVNKIMIRLRSQYIQKYMIVFMCT